MNRNRKWSDSDLRTAVSNSTSVRQVLIALGLVEAGGNYSQINKYIHNLKIDNSHFLGKGWSKGLVGKSKPFYSLSEILVRNSTYQSYKLKRRLFNENIKTPKCELCGWAKKTIDGRLPLELDHINGIHTDNRIENLQVLCPNCHSLQPTHRGRNKKKG